MRARAARLLGRAPKAAWLCAAIACINAVSWSILTPAFQVPDEPDHFAYVKQLAETGTRPTSSISHLAPEIEWTLRADEHYQVRQQPQHTALASEALQEQFKAVTSATVGVSHGSPTAGVATGQPPLYYALEAVPYLLTRHSPIPDRLALMRLCSTLFAAITAMFVFMFIREALPAEPWAWTVGGLAVAVAPLLGFVSGAVNPEGMLYAVAAVTFYLLARAFRRGLTTRLAVTIGVTVGIGLVTKLNYAGLLPGILLGLAIASVRVARTSRTAALWRFAVAVGIGLSPAGLVVLANAFAREPLLGAFHGALALDKGSLLDELNYAWQLYLPHLPGTVDDFPGLFPARQIWFNGYVGLYGWLDTTFPLWVYNFALLPAVAIALLCARALFESRAALRSRLAELVVYATMSAGVLWMIGAASYGYFPGVDAYFSEVRYFLPMLALFGVLLALAARGAGRRWGPVAGALIVMLFLAHDLFSQALEIGRYYG